MKQNSFAN